MALRGKTPVIDEKNRNIPIEGYVQICSVRGSSIIEEQFDMAKCVLKNMDSLWKLINLIIYRFLDWLEIKYPHTNV